MVPKTKVTKNGKAEYDQPTSKPTAKVRAAGYGGLVASLISVVLTIVDVGVDTDLLYGAVGAGLLSFANAYLKRSET